MEEPLLEIRGLAKRFGKRSGRELAPWIIQDLTFSVSEGEFLTVIGPSGAGKTTLLNIIAQIDVASGGEVRFQSQSAPIDDLKALQPGLACRIGYVTQDDHLLPWRTTLQNVLFPLTVQGRLNAETRTRAEMLIRTVGLGGFENHYPHELSGGMRKRAALIRTLVYNPPVILMDDHSARSTRKPGPSCKRICCGCGISGRKPSSSSLTISPKQSRSATAR